MFSTTTVSVYPPEAPGTFSWGMTRTAPANSTERNMMRIMASSFPRVMLSPLNKMDVGGIAGIRISTAETRRHGELGSEVNAVLRFRSPGVPGKPDFGCWGGHAITAITRSPEVPIPAIPLPFRAISAIKKGPAEASPDQRRHCTNRRCYQNEPRSWSRRFRSQTPGRGRGWCCRSPERLLHWRRKQR